MGQTDGPFKAFIRFLLNALEEAEKETDPKKSAERRKIIIESLRDILEH